MSRPLRISLVQMHVDAGRPQANFAHAAKMLNEAVQRREKPDVIMLPEMWNTGYALERIADIADRDGEETRGFISAFCRGHGVNVIAGSVAARRGDQVRNTIYAFDREGNVLADYAKLHLFRLMDEEKYLHPGDKPAAVTVDGTEAGMMICYDLRFPELARRMAVEGAELLFVPAEWPVPRMHHWRTLLMARAIENQMIVAACNRVGVSGDTEFFGHSMIVDAWGEVVAEGGEQEEIVTAVVDVEQVGQVRRAIPVFADRRTDVYG